jgi:hypothetical protein
MHTLGGGILAKRNKAVDELFVRRLELWQKRIRRGEAARGSVVVLRRPCTRKGCRRCASGERHPASYLGYREGGKLHWLYLPATLVPRAKEWVRNYRAMEKVLADISATNVGILRLWAKEMSQKNPARKKGGRQG